MEILLEGNVGWKWVWRKHIHINTSVFFCCCEHLWYKRWKLFELFQELAGWKFGQRYYWWKQFSNWNNETYEIGSTELMKLHVFGSWIFLFNFQAGWTSKLRFEMEIFQWQGRKFHPTQQGQGEVLLVGGAFCHWFETYVQVKLQYLARYGQRKTFEATTYIFPGNFYSKKNDVVWHLRKKKQRRFLRWTANIEFHVHILSLLSPKNQCLTKLHQVGGYQSIDRTTNQFLIKNGFSFHICPLAPIFVSEKTNFWWSCKDTQTIYSFIPSTNPPPTSTSSNPTKIRQITT